MKKWRNRGIKSGVEKVDSQGGGRPTYGAQNTASIAFRPYYRPRRSMRAGGPPAPSATGIWACGPRADVRRQPSNRRLYPEYGDRNVHVQLFRHRLVGAVARARGEALFR